MAWMETAGSSRRRLGLFGELTAAIGGALGRALSLRSESEPMAAAAAIGGIADHGEVNTVAIGGRPILEMTPPTTKGQ